MRVRMFYYHPGQRHPDTSLHKMPDHALDALIVQRRGEPKDYGDRQMCIPNLCIYVSLYMMYIYMYKL